MVSLSLPEATRSANTFRDSTSKTHTGETEISATHREIGKGTLAWSLGNRGAVAGLCEMPLGSCEL